MTSEPPLSRIEEAAVAATTLPAFPINVLKIRRAVTQLLTEFGKHGLFEEYTVHDITHVDELLRSLDWLIPKSAKDSMSPADNLLLTLACYLHDLGLVVTKTEYNSRVNSGFPKFCEDRLFSGPDGDDYRAKIEQLDPAERDRVLYQEYVRFNHAARVRAWIEGKPDAALGQAEAIAKELGSLLGHLDADTRRDLALICESHNLDDLEDTVKYELSKPYGGTSEETANLQYVAVMLRTADLLHITRSRAPTVLFHTVDPKDPISQVEWVKQNGVKSVRAQVPLDAEGNADTKGQSTTIEVHAKYNNPDGFFGLEAYLRYASKEISKSFKICEQSRKKIAKDYLFPWRNIDDSFVKAEGFLARHFGFVIDQERILELLTGHTLYNDSSIAIREIVQNSVDAVRLQSKISGHSVTEGSIRVNWFPANSVLEVIDNGTGMTQEIIENHLLKVGSSRYQDEDFKEKYPGFSPISRFGIGVLSAFMIADEVEIVTCADEDSEARQISLRSVHGRYLIRLLPKKAEGDLVAILPRGTIVRLTLRESAKKVDVLRTVQRWILFPGCRVEVSVDGAASVPVGHATPKDFLHNYLQSTSDGLVGSSEWKVEQVNMGPLTIAFAMSYNEFYREWSLVGGGHRLVNGERPPLAIAVEGIAVESWSPGFTGPVGILAIANTSGTGAPRTNVARTSIENTPELTSLLKSIYLAYTQVIDFEITRLVTEGGYSLSSALHEFPFISGALLNQQAAVRSPESLAEAIDAAQLFLAEDATERRRISIDELKAAGSFSSLESPTYHSVEQLIREVPGNVRARSILGEIGTPFPNRIVVSEPSQYLVSILKRNFDVAEINCSEKDRSIELIWKKKELEENWTSSEELINFLNESGQVSVQNVSNFFEQNYRSRHRVPILIPKRNIRYAGLDKFVAADTTFGLFLNGSNAAVKALIENLKKSGPTEAKVSLILAELVRTVGSIERSGDSASRYRMERMVRKLLSDGILEDGYSDRIREFTETLLDSNTRVFDPFARWLRTPSQF